mmetsp:Transcript_13252/g.21590  ORF Transcript_13252/g.21590 Transcript_13252/m.21590 type:complete len:195 (+) Transcript_13252:53-637(+)|eukprot:CAMPEP_0203749806 /NCGR_PEP_ID=MMETSP0098-20131031/4219_1 /ASSEMBLY_ACC=CAM_ASM_000208 /TAXON_ID=96639 /ORGANISM=" , Strain NY0313808BC1" /LENGTH=194 /DNA_ID=CAMNT_0050638913 /DNA_START=43 /DNA_END=627 /DNA_ORIENTATION=+
MKLTGLLTCALALVHSSTATISASRSVKVLSKDYAEVKVDIDGCKKTDKYGCKEYNIEWGKNISGKVHAVLKKDIQAGTKVEVDVKIRTGIFPLPFKVTCELCGKPCSFKIPVVNIPKTIEMPPCPIKAGKFDQAFNEMIPANDPVPMKLGVDGSVEVVDASGNELAYVHVFARADKPHTESKKPFGGLLSDII